MQEIEVKLTIPPSLIRDPINNPVYDFFSSLITSERVVNQTDSYRHTDDPHSLLRFRCHEDDREIIAGWKTHVPDAGELFSRCEVEHTVLRNVHGDIHKATREIAPYLHEYAYSSVTRALLMIYDRGNKAEVTIDLGKAVSGTRHAVISEIELELKQGSIEWLKNTAYLLKSHIYDKYGYQMRPSFSKGHLATIACEIFHASKTRSQAPSPL